MLQQLSAYDVPALPMDPGYLVSSAMRLAQRSQRLSWTPLTPEEARLQIRTGALCAIDAEFVARREEEAEIRPDGTRALLRPSRLALARVSVVRGEVRGRALGRGCPVLVGHGMGAPRLTCQFAVTPTRRAWARYRQGPLEGVPFIDDYIQMTTPVADYLTKFSGINPGDLDPSTSPHALTTLKVRGQVPPRRSRWARAGPLMACSVCTTVCRWLAPRDGQAAYTKLRILVDHGCIFVGHGLKQDFRIISMPPVVPGLGAHAAWSRC